jgi:DNA-binding MarR family transcriptional regulator
MSRAIPRRAASGTPVELADRLHSAAIHLLRRVRREDVTSGLPAPQLSALSVIVFAGPIALGALAEAEQVRPPTMTRVVIELERRGLVSRETGADDRRITRVTATAQGSHLLQEGRRRRVASLVNTLSQLTGRERALLGRALPILERLARQRSE